MTTISVSHRDETERPKADQRVGVSPTSQGQDQHRALRDDPLGRPQTPLQPPAIYSPTHYAPSGVVPGPHLGDPKGQEGPGALVMVAQAGPPAADFGTAPPCGGGLYGGPARGLTFSSWRISRVRMDNVGMEPKTAAPTFFTERSLATYLAVSDRTIPQLDQEGRPALLQARSGKTDRPGRRRRLPRQRRDEAA